MRRFAAAAAAVAVVILSSIVYGVYVAWRDRILMRRWLSVAEDEYAV